MRLKLSFLMVLALGLGSACRHKGDELESSDLASSASLNPTCPLPTSCTKGLPELSKPSGFDTLYNRGLARVGFFSHHARDVIAIEGQPVWIIGKFTYGYLDALLKGEEVDIYLAKGCNSALQKIGSTKTTQVGEHVPVEGVTDDGGRIYVELSTLEVKLPLGRHRLVLVVPADNSYAEMFVDIVKPDTKFVVSDIDGTLTSGEYAAATEIINRHPPAHPGAADALYDLYNKGYHIFYLTARPEWFTYRTRAWLEINNFPPGILHTTSSLIGANGAAASRFKTSELSLLKSETEITPFFAFGNKESDVKAFGDRGILPINSYYFNLAKELTAGGNSHTDYNQLRSSFKSQNSVCPVP